MVTKRKKKIERKEGKDRYLKLIFRQSYIPVISISIENKLFIFQIDRL